MNWYWVAWWAIVAVSSIVLATGSLRSSATAWVVFGVAAVVLGAVAASAPGRNAEPSAGSE